MNAGNTVSDRNWKVFERLYGKARVCEDLPWHDPEPPPLLIEALDSRDAPGTALDIGCSALASRYWFTRS